MKTLLAVVAMAGTVWAQGQPQSPPIGAGGVAAPTVRCAGGCASHGACCAHNRTSMVVVDAITSSGAAWRQLMMGGQRVTLSSALSAGVDVEELVRTVDATYGPCLACACPTRPHACGGSQYMSTAHWKIKYTREQIAAILKDAKGKEWAAVESAAWSSGTVLEFTCAMAGCLCDAGPLTQGPNDQPLVRGGRGSGGVNSAGDGKGGKPQEEPRDAPGLDQGKKPFLLSGEIKGGVGGARGDDIASDANAAFAFSMKYLGFGSGFFVYFEDEIVNAEVEFTTTTQDRFQPILITVEDEEDITIHAVTLGAGYEYLLSPLFGVYGKFGVGRYFISGADGVNGHVIATLDLGGVWHFAEHWSALIEIGSSFGSAHVHAGDGEGDLRGTWGVLVGIEGRF